MRSDVQALINPDHLRHNLRALRGRTRPGVKVCAPLKADAYGHGLRVVAPILQAEGVEYAAVATVPEAIELRECGWEQPILLLGNVLAVGDEAERRERLAAIVEYRLAVTIADSGAVLHLARYAGERRIEVHVKVDTGMGRMGAMPHEAMDLVECLLRVPSLRIAGIYSHFATADFEQRELVEQQLSTFRRTLHRLGHLLPGGALRHLSNSAATITLPEAHFDMVRPGLALYGYYPAAHMAADIDLRPALRVVSHVTLIKNLPAGHCVGYAATFTTRRPTRLGIVPSGYFDGYLRVLSNVAQVGTAGGAAPVIGRISMDQLAVDLTDRPEVRLGSPVELISDRPEAPNSVASLARAMGTIPYEVTCLLGPRIQRIAAARSSAESADPSTAKPQPAAEPMCRTR